MNINGIIALSENNVIGADFGLPWNLPNDLKMFKERTLGHTVIMGRNTFESIGRPLPKRHNTIITSKYIPNVHCVLSPEEALSSAFYNGAQEVFIIGGAQTYRSMEPFICRWYVTRVHTDIIGDTSYDLSLKDFALVSDEFCPADEKHEHSYSFRVYKRRGDHGRLTGLRNDSDE